MAIYHLSMRTHKRSAGRSAISGAAYRHGTRLKDTLLNEWSSSFRDKEVLARGLVVPPGEKMMGLSQMWNLAERAEKRCNSVVAREIDVALPIELPPEARTQMVKDMAAWISERYGIGVDYAIHGDDPNNPHAHLGMTTRRLEMGQFTKKTRELDDIKQGPVEVEAMRKRWAFVVNNSLCMHELDERVDHRSYARQGIKRIPGKHLGPSTSSHLAQIQAKEAKAEIAEATAAIERAERAARIKRISEIRSVRLWREERKQREHAPVVAKAKERGLSL